MLERDIEKKLVAAVKAAGGKAYKWVSPGNPGVPDRIVILPDGEVHFVEIKTDTGVLSRNQKLQLNFLDKLGHKTYVVQGVNGLDAYVKQLTDREYLRGL